MVVVFGNKAFGNKSGCHKLQSTSIKGGGSCGVRSSILPLVVDAGEVVVVVVPTSSFGPPVSIGEDENKVVVVVVILFLFQTDCCCLC